MSDTRIVLVSRERMRQWKWHRVSSDPSLLTKLAFPDFPRVAAELWNANFDLPKSPWFRDKTDEGTVTSIRLAHGASIRRSKPTTFDTARAYLEYLWIKDCLGYLDKVDVPLVKMPDTFHVQIPKQIRDKYLGENLVDRFRRGCGYYRNQWQLRVLAAAMKSAPWVPVGTPLVNHHEEFPPDVLWAFRALAIQRGTPVKALFMGAVQAEYKRWLMESQGEVLK